MIEVFLAFVALICYLHFEDQKWADVAAFSKPLIIAPLIFRSLTNNDDILTIGLAFSMIADFFLDLPFEINLVRGLTLFTAAQFCYALSFIQRAEIIRWRTLVPYVILSMIVTDTLKSRLSKRPLKESSTKLSVRAAVFLYISISSLTGGLSFNHALETGNYMPLYGTSCFIVSDLLIAQDRFVRRIFESSTLVMSTYLMAQILISS